MRRKKGVLLLVFLISLFLAVNYQFIDYQIEEFLNYYESGFVGRIVDGDTAIINGNSTRLLGINTPEKGERYYQEAKDFLSGLILNKTVEMEYGKDQYDQYGRRLAYITLEEKNINVELVRNGFANIYLLNDKRYKGELDQAWKECIDEGINLCEKSENKCTCAELREFYDQSVVLYNNCGFDCNLTGWTIKDEGRKKFVFENFILRKGKEVKIIVGNGRDDESALFWEGEEYVWTKTGDTLFLRDREGKLVLWKGY